MNGELRIKRINSNSIELAAAKNNIERYAESREANEIYKEGVKSVIAERVHAAKVKIAIDLSQDLYSHAAQTADEFSREAFARLDAKTGNVERDDYFESILHGQDGLLERFGNHLKGLLEVGMTNIALEVHKPVIVQKEEKKGWFR